MKKKHILILLFSIVNIALYAVPAYPKKIEVTTNGENIYILLKGDENCKYAVDELGYTILSTEKGWYYADEDESGNVILSDYELLPVHMMTKQTRSFLNKTRKGIVPISRETTYIRNHSMTNSTSAERKPATGSRRALVILMQYKDTKFQKNKEDFQRLFNKIGYNEDGAMGSVHDYYQWASYGQLNLKSDILGPYTAQNSMSYYGGNTGVGGNDKNPYELFSEAINHAVQEVNLSDYDADGDGYVDNIHIIYAGYGEEAGASSNAIWAHEMTFRTITVQGMKIDRYSCAPELRGNRGNGISRIGPHCHEIGHALGAMDYYDTDYETGGNYSGTGKWDIMASGSWNNDGISPADFNPYVKVYNFGWTEAKLLKEDTINVIGISSEKGNIYRVNTGTTKDFFLLENRDQKEFHSAEPGKGLLIFHIGPNLESRASTNTINSTYPQQCYVVCASSSYKKPSSNVASYGDINSAGCPYPGTSHNTEFNDTSTPAALTINGRSTGINIIDITYKDDNIVFHYGNKNSDDPDRPDDQTGTPGDVYLWGEDFEQLRLPSSWNYTDIYKSGEIDVVTKLSENDTPQSPVAQSGRGYAKYVSMPQPIIGEYRTAGRLMSPRISLAEGRKYMLALSARKYNNIDSHDTITIKLFNEEGNDECEIIKREINAQNNWTRYSIDIPDNYKRFLIGIIFNIDYKSIMFIDNITISEKSDETGVISISRHISEESFLPVYSLMGLKRQKYRYGINIVRMPDGSYKKVYIKQK